MIRAILHRIGLAILICVSTLVPPHAFAQSAAPSLGLRGIESSVLIRSNPADPAPGDLVQFSVESPLFDLQQSDITWTINNVIVAQGVAEKTVDFLVDSTATVVEVSVQVNDPSWGSASSAISIVPLQLDLLFDAPSYTPPFYRGRSMPSSGGTIRLQAIARFPGTKGILDDSSITYTWSRNGRTLGNLSGRGRSSITIDAPLRGDTDTISVRATANGETLSATASAKIPWAQPIIALYEDHPLYGILFHEALAPSIPSVQETTVAAIPYFATITRLNDPALTYTWEIDEKQVSASSTKRNEITVPNTGEATTLTLGLSHAVNFFFDTQSKWRFLFGSAGAGARNAETINDMFHSAQ